MPPATHLDVVKTCRVDHAKEREHYDRTHRDVIVR